jgi:hypothetical protein
VTPKEKISKLEALLAKVKSRAGGPRRSNGSAAFVQGVAGAAAAPAPAPAPSTPAAFVPAAPPPRAATVPPVVAPPRQPSTIPPAPRSTPPPPTEADNDSVEVEVAEVVEVDIDVDEPMPMMAESGAQPVAEHAPLPEEAEPEPEPPAHAGPPANEIEEPAPSSSPRPIVNTIHDAEESAPRHTPPPESGKQVAATPVPPRKPSAPPPSMEGHTLIGGWREPGLAPMVSSPGGQGVRVPAPPPQAIEAASTVVQHVPPETARTGMAPEVTRPELPGAARVAAFQGAPPAARASTFGEIIDETLDL